MTLGVASCSYVDVFLHFGAAFKEFAPELTILPEDEIEDPEAVRFIVTFKPDDGVFDRFPNVEAVFSLGAGVDAILSCASLPEGMPVFRVNDPAQATQMAGFAAFHVLWHHRGMTQYLENQANALWDRPRTSRSPGIVRVGVMGFGHMGRAIAAALVHLGYDVACWSRSMPDNPEPGVDHFDFDGQDEFLKGCQILINVLPLTDQTNGILNADLFAKLPEGACLVQLGRGQHLVDQDLLSALESGHIGGASLDVFSTEPLPAEHVFWSHPKIVVTPHTACAPEIRTVVQTVRDGLAQIAAGERPLERLGRGY